MPNIIKFEVVTDTGSYGTDGKVYLGLGGREFRLNSGVDDFIANSAPTTFVFGLGSTVNNSPDNDPRSPFPLTTENVDKYPIYIRFEPSSDTDIWTLASVTVSIFTTTTAVKTYGGLAGTGIYLILGARSTKRFDFGS